MIRSASISGGAGKAVPLPRIARGFTVVEVLVGALIFIVLAGGAYKILASMRLTAALTTAKAQAKDHAEICLKALEKDISSSQATVDPNSLTNGSPTVTLSFAPVSGGWTMLVPEAGSFKRITYLYDGMLRLTRNDASGTARVLSDHVTKLTISELKQEQYTIEIRTAFTPEGSKSPQEHRQTLIVTIRAAITNNLDARWRNTQDVLNNY